MLCNVWHHWPARVRFTFKCYNNWSQILLFQSGDLPVTFLSREGVTQGESLLVVVYGITLAPLVEELKAADPGLISPIHAGDAEFHSSVRRSAHILMLIMGRGPDHGYLPNPARSIFIADSPEKEEAARGGLQWRD